MKTALNHWHCKSQSRGGWERALSPSNPTLTWCSHSNLTLRTHLEVPLQVLGCCCKLLRVFCPSDCLSFILKWFIFKHRSCGSIWSTSCFLPCPQTRAVEAFLWNLWQADVQRLPVTGAQRTQVQIHKYSQYFSTPVLSQRMKWHWWELLVLEILLHLLLAGLNPLQRRIVVFFGRNEESDSMFLEG